MKLTNNLKNRIRKIKAVNYENGNEYFNDQIPQFHLFSINAIDFTKNEIARIRKEVRYMEKYRK